MSAKFSLAILGPSGIGRIHAREFHHAGATITAVHASTPESTQRAAEEFSRTLGRPVRACTSMDEVLDEDVDAISVCTPPGFHLAQIEAALSGGKYVFCEKPLFWRPELDPAEASAICDRLAALAGGRLVLNTNNVHLLSAYAERFGLPERLVEFEFRFLTRGSCRGDAIGVDLLPHALSLVLHLEPDGRLANLQKMVAADRFLCAFEFSGIRCRFDLREDPEGPRDMGFVLNEDRIRRIQESDGGELRIYLVDDENPGEKIRVADPFRVSVSHFVDGARAGASFGAAFGAARRNMILMSEILAAPANTMGEWSNG